MSELKQFGVGDGKHLVAIVTLEKAGFLVDDVQARLHGLVVGDTFGVGAAHDVGQLIGHAHGLLFRHLIVVDDAERDIGRDDRKLVELLVGEKLVGHLDDALGTHFLALQIEADGDGSLGFFQMEQVDDLEYLGGGDVVDDGAVFQGGHL